MSSMLVPAAPSGRYATVRSISRFSYMRRPSTLEDFVAEEHAAPVVSISSGNRKIEAAKRDVLTILSESSSDFVAISALERKTGHSRALLNDALRQLGGEVRTPFGGSHEESNLYRLTTRGLTRAERRRRLRLSLTRG